MAATGRLSSSDPNLQNIPVRTEAGREIRSAFVPGEPGWVLLAADYSQIELRVLAHYCGDENLAAAFARDEDIHARVASQVYGVPLEQVTEDMRRQAKAVNFGVIYGQSPFGLARQLGISKEDAAAIHQRLFRRISRHRGLPAPRAGRLPQAGLRDHDPRAAAGRSKGSGSTPAASGPCPSGRRSTP